MSKCWHGAKRSTRNGRGKADPRLSAAVNAVMRSSQSDVQDVAAQGGWHGMPALAAEIAIDADFLDADRRTREIRQNQREMAGACDHRVLAVGLALIGPAGMDVNVRDNAQSAPPARIPKRAEKSAVQTYDAGVERMGIEIIIENEIGDAGTGPMTVTKQKSAAFPAMAVTPFAQVCDEPAPQNP